MTDLGHNSHQANAGGLIAARLCALIALLVLRTSDFLRGQTTGSEIREKTATRTPASKGTRP